MTLKQKNVLEGKLVLRIGFEPMHRLLEAPVLPLN